MDVLQVRQHLKANPGARVLVWFSCGDASAAAAKIVVNEFPNAEVLYCDTLKYEHSDNIRFMRDVEKWIGRKIKILKSSEYRDIFDVFDKTGWLLGPAGARYTTELKKNVRIEYQRPDDVHVFGFTAEEESRIKHFDSSFLDTLTYAPLFEYGLTKYDCHRMVIDAGIQIPAMYSLGYKNNNCIGCVKGGMGYWNKIRKDFPKAFDRMAKQERKMNVSLLSDRRNGTTLRMFLDELEPDRGRYDAEIEIECGVLCNLL